MTSGVPRVVQSLLHSLPMPHRLRLDRDLRNSGRRRAQFVSFLEASGYRTHDVDTYERSLKRRKAGKFLLVGGGVFLLAWVIIESARAVTLF